MRLIRHTQKNIPHPESVVTIGVFDGVHAGHESLLLEVKKIAKENKMASCVVFFEKQPKEFFLGDDAPPRITSFRDKMIKLHKFSIDTILCLKFNSYIGNLEAEEFIKKYLVDTLNVKELIVGDDFCFGKNRSGDFNKLKELGNIYDFKVKKLSSIEINKERISSSIIRKKLLAGDFESAKKLLNAPYTISGIIHHGLKNGRKIGFPTINLPLKHRPSVSGVYIVKARIDNYEYFGISNVGIRPTITFSKRLLEVHIFSFNKDVYGKHANIEFLYHIRAEKKFASFDELTQQIKKDKSYAIEWLKNKFDFDEAILNKKTPTK